jgi:hypothetical protein
VTAKPKPQLESTIGATLPTPAVRRRVYSATGRNIVVDASVRRFGFAELTTAPLLVDAIYQGGVAGDLRDDPIAKMFPGAGNQGGFRAVGGRQLGSCRALVLLSSGSDPDWPDRLDAESGEFTYYGDNKRPGHAIHETARGGNRLLEQIFGAATSIQDRSKTPPILVFTSTGEARDILFCGLAVPSGDPEDGLVAVWRQADGRRFQNYKARFDILQSTELSRAWIQALCAGDADASNKLAPTVWRNWIERGQRAVLRAPRTVQHRTREEQLPAPSDRTARSILAALRSCFVATPHDFEFVAAEIFQMIEPRVFDIEITRKSADGGRDAVGRIRIGGAESESDGIYSDFALEAKAYAEGSGVGVKETSRLISRLRHRQFGVIVTTSYVSTQAYKELREDQHPVVIVAAADIARILRTRGIATTDAVREWVRRILVVGERVG